MSVIKPLQSSVCVRICVCVSEVLMLCVSVLLGFMILKVCVP